MGNSALCSEEDQKCSGSWFVGLSTWTDNDYLGWLERADGGDRKLAVLVPSFLCPGPLSTTADGGHSSDQTLPLWRQGGPSLGQKAEEIPVKENENLVADEMRRLQKQIWIAAEKRKGYGANVRRHLQAQQ